MIVARGVLRRVRRDDLEIGVAAGEIKLLQRVLVGLEALVAVDVALVQPAQPARSPGRDDRLQPPAGEGVVTDEGDRGDADAGALVDDESDIDAIVRQRLHLRRDHRGAAALTGVVVTDADDVVLNDRVGQDVARFDRCDRAQHIRLNLRIALEYDRIDDRVLDDGDDHRAAAGGSRDRHVGEQAGVEQCLLRGVEVSVAVVRTLLDRQVRLDCGGINPLVTFYGDALRDGSVCLSSRRRHQQSRKRGHCEDHKQRQHCPSDKNRKPMHWFEKAYPSRHRLAPIF